MPPNQRVWLYDGEHPSPVDPPCEQDQCDPGRIVGSGRDATFGVERQLLPQKEILGHQSRPRSQSREIETSAHQPADGRQFGTRWTTTIASACARMPHESDNPWRTLANAAFRSFQGVRGIFAEHRRVLRRTAQALMMVGIHSLTRRLAGSLGDDT
jgi:hypothetical protein